MLLRRNESDVVAGRAVPVCLFLCTYFYQQLTNGGRGLYTFDRVRRWTARRDLLSVDLVFVVVNHGGEHGNNWTLAVFHTIDGAVEHCDSNGCEHTAVTSTFRRWFRDAVRSRGRCHRRLLSGSTTGRGLHSEAASTTVACLWWLSRQRWRGWKR